MNEDEADRKQAGHLPYRGRLPGFINDKDIGLGDVLKRVTSTFGIRPCAGCERRAAMLNRRFVISARPK
jgi:hypothetical protein